MFYTYLHRRADDNLPFYVGKGTGDRAHRTNNRNPYWHKTVKKHGLVVEIVSPWRTEKEAFEHEKFLIHCFKDMGFNLVNMSDGGEGQSGYRHNDETKKKLSEASKKKVVSASERDAASERMKGNSIWLGRKHSAKAKQKISVGNKGKTAGSKNLRYGKPIPDSQKQAISNATSGAKHRAARAVMCIETGVVYATCTEASVAMTGSKNSRSTMSKAAQNASSTLYGYHWKYI